MSPPAFSADSALFQKPPVETLCERGMMAYG